MASKDLTDIYVTQPLRIVLNQLVESIIEMTENNAYLTKKLLECLKQYESIRTEKHSNNK